jgi:hypothetical protein
MHDEISSVGGGEPAQAAVDTSERPLDDGDSGRLDVSGGDESTTTGFLHEIGSAMVEVAERERDRITRVLTEQLGAHLEDLRSRASDEAKELMRLAEADVDAIRGSSTAEQERIRQDTERRIEARRAELERHLSHHDADLEREIAASSDRIEAYRAELDGFVRRLAEEPDPTEIARQASQMPSPPRVEDVLAAAHAQVIAEAATRHDRESVSGFVLAKGINGNQANADLVAVMDPGLTGPVVASTGEMVGGSRPAPVSRPPHRTVESRVGAATESVDDESETEAASRPGWSDLALRFLPLILLVIIVAAVAYLLISGRGNAFGA